MDQLTEFNLDALIVDRKAFISKLGSGAYGHVFKVKDKCTKQIFALKKIFNAFQHSTDAKRTYRQIAVLRQLSHTNIIRLYKVIKSQNDKDLYLIFESMECDLQLAISQGNLESSHLKYITYQMLKGLKYLRTAELIHRDLKPSNVLINTRCKIKICDFGLVRSLAVFNSQQPVLTNQVATRWYRAPEVLLGSKDYSYPADIWSIGCVLFQMFSKKPMFSGKNTLDQLQKICSYTGMPTNKELQNIGISDSSNILQALSNVKVRAIGEWFAMFDPMAVDLITRMVVFNPSMRIKIEDAIMHPYVAEYRSSVQQKSFQGKIKLGVSQNKKLTVRQYRHLIHQEIRNYYNDDLEEVSLLEKKDLKRSRILVQRNSGVLSLHKHHYTPDKYKQNNYLLRTRSIQQLTKSSLNNIVQHKQSFIQSKKASDSQKRTRLKPIKKNRPIKYLNES